MGISDQGIVFNSGRHAMQWTERHIFNLERAIDVRDANVSELCDGLCGDMCKRNADHEESSSVSIHARTMNGLSLVQRDVDCVGKLIAFDFMWNPSIDSFQTGIDPSGRR